VTTPAIRANVEDLITSIDRIRAGAFAGNAHAKLAALAACNVACARFAAMAQALSRDMGDVSHFGPEITEPASTAGIHLTAAASAFAESHASLKTLLDMRMGEVPGSGRQAPHHAELSETGAR
jgi:hypothetical protein